MDISNYANAHLLTHPVVLSSRHMCNCITRDVCSNNDLMKNAPPWNGQKALGPTRELKHGLTDIQRRSYFPSAAKHII